MSLINDALKKAQKQRTGEAPPLASLPSVGGQSAASISRRSKSGGPNPMQIWAGAGAGVLFLAVGGWFAFRPSPTATSADANPVSVAPSSSPAAHRPDEPAVDLAKAATSQSSDQSASVTFALPIAKPPKVETVAVAQQNADREPRPVVTPIARDVAQKSEPTLPSVTRSPSTEPAAPAKPAPALKLENRAVQFIDNIKVAGIRASATDAKVLMNDRVYRIGSVVEADMGLKLVGITANSLTFEDERGARYTRIL